MEEAGCGGDSNRLRRSSRKRSRTAEKDKEIYKFFDASSDSEGGMYSDSDPEFSQDDAECDFSESDSDGSIRYLTADTAMGESPVFLWGDVEEDFLSQISCSAGEIVRPHPSYPLDLDVLHPAQVYKVFFDQEVLDLIVSETNRSARRHLCAVGTNSSSRLKSWRDTDSEEIRKIFGLLLYMGLVMYPTIEDYWRTDRLYRNELVTTTMSRNRFQLLLRFVHFSNNEEADLADR